MNPTLQTLGQSVDHWQIVYIVSISFALLSTFAMVYFAFHKEHPVALRTSNYFYVAASFLAVLSTVVIVNKTKSVDAIKDTFVAKANSDAAEANAHAEQAKKDAATANQKAQEAHDEAVKVEAENIRLGGQVGQDAVQARAAEAALAKANKDTSDFAHSLQQQQVTMQQQAKVSPQLTPFQMQNLANSLRPYAGQDVELHTTADTVVERLASAIATSLNSAGVTTKSFSTDMGALYEGVSVAVHDPNNVPPLATTLVTGFRQAGIDAHPVAAPRRVPEGKVAVFLGPN